MLHEAVGHGLEGDFNRKKRERLRRVDGRARRLARRHRRRRRHAAEPRGSLTVDDEGTPTQSTTLIEDGILVGYMQDRQNARLMGMKPTGNGGASPTPISRCRG
jgi:TldD protein